MSIIKLKRNEDGRIRRGHLWVFSNEIASTEGSPENGDIVSLYDSRDNFLGEGFYNRNSLIAFRLLSYKPIQDLKELLREKLTAARDLRAQLYPNRNSYRLVFSESDFLPGLIIDRYNDTYVLQVYSQGIEKNIQLIVDVLREQFGAKNVFSGNESYFRRLEGLPDEDKLFFGEIPSQEVISDGKISYEIDFKTGQKTGFYFDQCDNREFVERLCAGKSAVDCFCNSGGFGLHAVLAGAKSVAFVDSSRRETQTAESNFRLNNLNCESEFIASDVFDYLEDCAQKGRTFDVVMIDPPAFAKNKKSLPQARKGYEKLNRMALALVNSGGYLVSSSCSFHLSEDEFLSVINSAAAKGSSSIQLVHLNNASLDHPRLLSMPETVYLKFAVFRKF